MHVGIFGGSFDPVHYGHLLLAESCREACALDRVLFVPAANSPHKPAQSATAAKHRVDMLRLAIGGHTPFELSELETNRGGMSYTVDTLQELHDLHPDTELSLLLGADSCDDFPAWRQPDKICELASLIVVGRPNAPMPNWVSLQRAVSPNGAVTCRCHYVEMPLIGFSSSDMRARVASGKSIRFYTPRAVEMYIQTHGLYRDGQAAGD
jgi:nicotinate-nucleotide adenylyltransferase